MPINVDNAQFKQFVDFAKDVGGRTIVQTGDAVDGGQLQIKAKTTRDFVGNIGRGKASRGVNDDVRALFKQSVLDMFGVSDERDLPPSVRRSMNLGDYGKGKPLTARRIMAVNAAIGKEMERALHVSGQGGARIASFIAKGSGILEAQNPGLVLDTRMRAIAKAEIQTHVVQQLGPALKANYPGATRGPRNLDGYATTFDKDSVRNQNISLADGTAVSKDPQEARRQLLRFMTGDSQATFETADHATKTKLHILMACLNQGFTACMISGIGGAYDAKGNMSLLSGGQIGPRTQSFVLSKDASGNITIDHKLKFNGPVIVNMMSNEGEPAVFKTDDKGYFEHSIRVTLKAASLDSLSRADWDSYDHKPVDGFSAEANEFVGRAQTIPAACKLDCDIEEISYHLQADELLPVG